VSSVSALQDFGKHEISFSCKKKRKDDYSIKWIGQQVEALLKSEGR
jgi:hypothetical protein